MRVCMSQVITKSGLEQAARRIFLEKKPTVELMASAQDLGDRFTIAIVALLEVDPALRYAGMPADEARFVKSCHAYLSSLATIHGLVTRT